MRSPVRYLLAAIQAAVLAGAVQAQGYGPPGGFPSARPPVQGLAPRVNCPPRGLELTAQMAHEIMDLREDIAIEVPDARGQDLSAQADNLLDQARHLEKSIRQGASREHLLKHAADLDRDLHRFLDVTGSLGRDGRYLNRSARRIEDLDHELLALLAPAVPTGPVVAPVPPPVPDLPGLAAQVRALDLQVHAFREAVRKLTEERPYGQDFTRDTDALHEETEHFHRAVDTGAPPERLRHSFEKVNASWALVSRDLNQLPPKHRILLTVLAQQVQATLDDVARRLGL